MDSVFGDSDKFKMSALRKSKSLNAYINDVTIGPNSTFLDKTTNASTKQSPKTVCKTTQTKSIIDLFETNRRTSRGKVLTELEVQVKDDIKYSIKTRFEKMVTANKLLHNQLQRDWLIKQENMLAENQQQEQVMLKTLAEHDKKASDHLERLKKHEEVRKKKNLEIQMKEQQQKQLLQMIESFQKLQHEFRIDYQEIVIMFKEFNMSIMTPSNYAVIVGFSQRIKGLAENMDKVKDKCKTGSLCANDLEFSNEYVQGISKVKSSVREFLLKLQEEVTKIAEEQRNLQQKIITSDATDLPQSVPINPKMENIQKTDSMPVMIIDTFRNKNLLKHYSNLAQFLQTYKSKFTQLLNDPRMKQFRFHCQKAVNIPLNSISAVNSHHMIDKFLKLSNLLRGNSVEAGGTTVTSSEHPEGIAFCTDLLARKFVQQGDLLISSNPDTAHCYAAVLIALWHDFPDFGQLVLAYFYQTASYLVPFYPPKISGQTDQDYYQSLGYNYIDGVVERQDKFLKRMSGTMRLYAALTISRLKKGQHGTHPHGLVFAWSWIANVLNIDPRSDITAQLIFDFIEVTGSSMLAAYGNQFLKILNFITDEYFEKMRKLDTGGPVTRLEVLLEKIKISGQIEPSKGRLPDGFW